MEVASALQFMGEPDRQRCGFRGAGQGGVGGGAGSDDVSAMGTDVDLPSQGTASAGAGGAQPAAERGGLVPDVQASGRGTHAKGAGVCGSAGLLPQGSEDGQAVETAGQAGEVDVIADRNAGQDPVARGRLAGVVVDIDDDQAGWAAGDSDAERRMAPPPRLDTSGVERGCMETKAPAAGWQARTTGGRVTPAWQQASQLAAGVLRPGARGDGPAPGRAPQCGLQRLKTSD